MAQPDDFMRLFNFVGVEAPVPALHQSHSIKWHTAPPESYVANADEVRRWFQSSQQAAGLQRCCY